MPCRHETSMVAAASRAMPSASMAANAVGKYGAGKILPNGDFTRQAHCAADDLHRAFGQRHCARLWQAAARAVDDILACRAMLASRPRAGVALAQSAAPCRVARIFPREMTSTSEMAPMISRAGALGARAASAAMTD